MTSRTKSKTAIPLRTFIIDCDECKAKVAAIETGRCQRTGFIDEISEPWGERILIGNCPSCNSILVGESKQIEFEGWWDAEDDRWSDIIRVYPRPKKTFTSFRIPPAVIKSLEEAEKAIQVNANIAACVMLGRALEALCRDILQEKNKPENDDDTAKKSKPIMLYDGLLKLKQKNIIDDRLYNWSQQLHAFRNLAAHPTDIDISRQDAEDLQSFVNAIIEYIYDLADRYNEFLERLAKKDEKRKKEEIPF